MIDGAASENARMARRIVVAELNQDVIGLGVEHLLPGAFTDETPGAAPAAGEVDHLHVFGETLGQALAPADGVGDGRVTRKRDPHLRRARCGRRVGGTAQCQEGTCYEKTKWWQVHGL